MQKLAHPHGWRQGKRTFLELQHQSRDDQVNRETVLGLESREKRQGNKQAEEEFTETNEEVAS